MLTIIADNTMILGSITDRQDARIVTTSTMMRGLERLAVRLMRAVVPVVALSHVYCEKRPAMSCQRFMKSKHWQLGLSGKKLRLNPLGYGLPTGSGRHIAG